MGLLPPSNKFLDKGSPKNNYLDQKFSVGFAVHIPVCKFYDKKMKKIPEKACVTPREKHMNKVKKHIKDCCAGNK